MRNLLCWAALSITASVAPAQQFDFPEAATSDRAVLSTAMPALAKQILATYRDSDPATYLDNLFRLQLVAGQDSDALATLQSLRELRRRTDPALADWVDVQYEIYARARSAANREDAYKRSFRDVLGRMDNRTSALLVRAMGANWFEGNLQNDLGRQKGKSAISLPDALKLARDYQSVETARLSAPLKTELIDEDDARRYNIQKDFPVKTPDGGTICTIIVRPKNLPARAPALLEYTIYADGSNFGGARLSASHGYNAVIGLVRGKGCSPDTPVPYERDASDAASLINWITAQPWSDGRVGMYGGSYSGGSAWAAAKRMPKGLKAIAVGAPVAPGIDVPMEGNVVWNFIYPWPFYTMDLKVSDEKVYGDTARWTRLNHDWYVSGRAYRDLDKIDGTPNPIFDRWISHPDYDAYWQKLIPYREDFARIRIPVLQTAGYYYGGPGAAVYYMTQHEKFNPRAEHYLLIGPYHHFGAQVGTIGLIGQTFPTIAGYKLDPVAMIDIEALRYQWFDWIFKNAPRPELLKDHVNYQVTGANVWKHAPSIEAMANRKLRFHLDSKRLTSAKPPVESAVTLKVDFADRSDVDRNAPGGGVLDKAVDPWNGLEFVSDPFPRSTELSGLFSGELDFETNRKDFDFEIDLYELTPSGDYVQLAPYWARASYVGDLSHRHLLTPEKRQRLNFKAVRLMSRQIAAGSRLVAVLTVIKTPDRQINYGTGKDVSDETIHDVNGPLEIRWFNDSYLDVPVSDQRAGS